MILGLVAASARASQSASPGADPFPELHIEHRVVYYPVAGKTAAQVRAQLENHGPQAAAPGHGRTRSEFQIASRLEPFDGGCALASAAVKLRTVTTVPEWVDPRGAPADMADRWAESVALLQRHEAGHRVHAVEAAQALQEVLVGLPAQNDCRRMQWAVDRELQRVVLKLGLRGNRYDARTGNGARDDPLAAEVSSTP